MDSARVLPCMVCSHQHNISRVEKKKVMKYIDGNIDIINNIMQYVCLWSPSMCIKYTMTRLQYKTLKYLKAISSIIRKLMYQHSIHTLHSHLCNVSGPLTCYQRSELFIFLCTEITENSYVVGEHFLKIDSDENGWRHNFDETIYLMYRINRSLWAYTLRYHPCYCRDCK